MQTGATPPANVPTTPSGTAPEGTGAAATGTTVVAGEQESQGQGTGANLAANLRFDLDVNDGEAPVTTTGRAYTLDGGALPDGTYCWSWGDEQEEDCGPVATHGQRTHAFAQAGIYAVSITLTIGGLTQNIGCVSSLGDSNNTDLSLNARPRIDGYVRDSSGHPLAGIPIVSNDGLSAVSNSNGYYRILPRYGWSGTLHPEDTTRTYTPPSRSYTNVRTNYSNQNYAGTLAAQFTISGRITDPNGAPLPSVVLNGLPGQPATDNNGNYSAAVNSGFSGTATPTKTGYTFAPPSRTYSNVSANVPNQNYTGTLAQFTISGCITDPNSLPLAGVVLSGLPGQPATDNNGNYAAQVSSGFSGTATPIKAGYTFSPPSRTYTNVTSNQLNQSYTGSLSQFAISGHIADPNNVPLVGVVLSGLPGQPPTDNNGNYATQVGYGFSGTATPTKSGYTFSPPSRTYSNVTSNQLNQNYTGSTLQFTISGHIADPNNAPLVGVVLSGLPGQPATDNNGNYAAQVGYGFSGTATPAKTGYTFNPPSRTYTNVTGNQTNQDYTGTASGGGSFAISGTVTHYNGTAWAGIQVVFTGSGGSSGVNFTATAAANGTYTQTVPAGWSGTTSTDSNYHFQPASRTYSNVAAPFSSQGYVCFRNYFVATNGVDNPNGLINSPLATLNKAFQLIATGDTIYLRGGTYAGPIGSGFSRLTPTVSGAADAYITLASYDGEHAVIDSTIVGADMRFLYLQGIAYWHFVGLEVTNFSIPFDITPTSGGTPTHDLTFDNCHLHHMGVPIDAEGKVRIHDNVYNLTFSNCEIDHSAGPGVNIGGAVHDVLFQDCSSHDNDDGRGADGDADGFNVDVGAQWSQYANRITFRRCRAWNVSEDCFDVKGDNIVFDRCEARHAGGCCYKFWSISDTTNQIGYAQTRFTMTNSLGYDASDQCLKIIHCPIVKVINSTFVQTKDGHAATGEAVLWLRPQDTWNAWTGQLYSRNNVFLHLGTWDDGDTCARSFEYTKGNWSSLDMDYDVFMTPNVARYCIVERTNAHVYTPTQVENGSFAAAEHIETHVRGVVPAFVNLAGGDLHLSASDTVARNAGADMSSQGVVEDLEGTARPQGPAYDRGSYERS